MEKKEVKLTKEGLELVTVLNYSNLGEMSGFYDREIFFTGGFSGDLKYLFVCMGYIGGHPRSEDLNNDIDFVILSDKLLNTFDLDNMDVFFVELEGKLNQNNSPYRRIKFISEEHLIAYLEKRIKRTEDRALGDLLSKYKESKKNKKSKKNEAVQTLF
jgi:hypothetical protein